MGYSTAFTGVINLSRQLTIPEAKELLDIWEDGLNSEKITGVKAHFQWVPTETLDGIVWDGNEKFYEYIPQLEWLCRWLKTRLIAANGTLHWTGESSGDSGIITVADNVVTAKKQAIDHGGPHTPLTIEKLQQIALDRMLER